MGALRMSRPYYFITATAAVRALRASRDRAAVAAALVAHEHRHDRWYPAFRNVIFGLIGLTIGCVFYFVAMLCRG
jgi:hypothetical protein